MRNSISWKRLKESIQKKRENYIIKRARIFHSQLLDQPKQFNSFFLLPGRVRRKKKKKRGKPRGPASGKPLASVFRHQISRTRANRKKKRSLIPFFSSPRKRKMQSRLFFHARKLFRTELQKIAAIVRSTFRPNIFTPKTSLPLPAAKKAVGKQIWLKRLAKKASSRRKQKTVFFWRRRLRQLKRKKVLRGNWRTRKYYWVRRRAQRNKASRLGRPKFSGKRLSYPQVYTGPKKLANPVKSVQHVRKVRNIKAKPIRKLESSHINHRKYPNLNKSRRGRKKVRFTYLAYGETAPRSYRIWRKNYLLFQEKRKKKALRKQRIDQRKNKRQKVFSLKTFNFRGKQKKPRRKRRHRFRRINRLRPSVMVRRRLRRKSRRFSVYSDQYTAVSARRVHLQLKKGYSLYKKRAALIASKNLWWLSLNLSALPRVSLNKNPIFFRRLVVLADKKKRKRLAAKNREMKLSVYSFLQTNKSMKAITIRKNKQPGKNRKDISLSSGLQKKKLGRLSLNLTGIPHRAFSNVASSQATKFFARKKKKGGKRLKKQKTQLKLKKKPVGKTVSRTRGRKKGIGRKRKTSRKSKRLLFGRLTGKKSFKFLGKKGKMPRNLKKQGGTRARPRRRRRLVHKNWTFRFPRWKIYYRNLWRYQKTNEKYRWVHADLFPGRRYRWIQQVYRHRHPRKEKKNKWIQRLTFQNQSYSLRKRKSRLVNRLMHFKLFSKFYGPFTSKRWAEKALKLRRINPQTTTRKSLSLSWYDHRLDITVYRIGLAPSLKVAQTLIARGYIFVNGSQNLSSQHRVDPWDVVAVTPYTKFKNFFDWYWFTRNQYRLYAFKRKEGQYKNVQAQKLSYPFGFRTRLLNELDLPRRDKIQGKEFERLLLWKSQPW